MREWRRRTEVTTMTVIIGRTYTSLEEILARKEEILREVRMTREEFDLRADNYLLGEKEAKLYFELDGLDYFEKLARYGREP